jgi:coenzyme F420 hydrogenase subunit beta
MLAMSSDEILAAAGTKYTFSPTWGCSKKQFDSTVLEKVEVANLPKYGNPKNTVLPIRCKTLSRKIALMLGIFCMENFPTNPRTFISEKAGVDFDLVEKLDIGKGNSGLKPQTKC